MTMSRMQTTAASPLPWPTQNSCLMTLLTINTTATTRMTTTTKRLRVSKMQLQKLALISRSPKWHGSLVIPSLKSLNNLCSSHRNSQCHHRSLDPTGSSPRSSSFTRCLPTLEQPSSFIQTIRHSTSTCFSNNNKCIRHKIQTGATYSPACSN